MYQFNCRDGILRKIRWPAHAGGRPALAPSSDFSRPLPMPTGQPFVTPKKNKSKNECTGNLPIFHFPTLHLNHQSTSSETSAFHSLPRKKIKRNTNTQSTVHCFRSSKKTQKFFFYSKSYVNPYIPSPLHPFTPAPLLPRPPSFLEKNTKILFLLKILCKPLHPFTPSPLHPCSPAPTPSFVPRKNTKNLFLLKILCKRPSPG
jgi:hypothetical protein